MVSVARNLSATEERREDQRCLFRRGTKARTPKKCSGFERLWKWFLQLENKDQSCMYQRDYWNECHSPEKLLGSNRCEAGFCNSETKHDIGRTQDQSCLFRRAVPLSPCRRQVGEDAQLLIILDLCTGWTWVVSVTPWVGLSAGLNTEAREINPLLLAEIKLRSSGSPVCSQTLHWLSYPKYVDWTTGHNPEKFVCSRPGKGAPCSSEAKHDRTAPRPKLFASKRRLNERRHSSVKSLVRVPVNMASATWKLNTTEKRRQNQSWLLLRGDYRSKDHNPEELSWVRPTVKIVSVAEKIRIENGATNRCLFRRGA
jgi:hypothetical protein